MWSDAPESIIQEAKVESTLPDLAIEHEGRRRSWGKLSSSLAALESNSLVSHVSPNTLPCILNRQRPSFDQRGGRKSERPWCWEIHGKPAAGHQGLQERKSFLGGGGDVGSN
ncbi:hypothetical protein LIER_10809 [Lithospermum erythrorhizon]|uniref:Uncharacterized protein n=1 Tax=Lithospermum erythrorhizon TaxID=34254 RepID=A0AAV3PM67_LITER